MRARIEGGIVYSPYTFTPRAENQTFGGFLSETLTACEPKTALMCGEDRVSYSNLREKVWRCTAGFRRQGVGKGDRVYVHFTNSIETFVAVCSLPLTGASLVSSDIMWREDDIVDKIERAGATAVLTDGDHVEMFARILSRCNVKKAFVVGEKRSGFKDVSEFSQKNELLDDDETFDSGDCTFVKWTTGTTGAPKGVEYSEERFVRMIYSVAASGVLSPADVLLGDMAICCLPVFSMWLLALHIGCTVAISKTCHAVPLDVFGIIMDCKTVAMLEVPSRLKRILEFMKTSQDWDALLRKKVKRITMIASLPPPGLAEELTTTFQLEELRNSYGMSEAGGCMTLPPRGEISCNSVGFPIAGARMKIIDPDKNKLLGPMQCGELVFDTPCAAIGYCGHLDPTAAITDEEGWIHTGDMAYYDHNGRLFLCGRLKTMMVCQRRKVFPCNIEHCLMEHAAVKEVVVIGVPTPHGDELPAAVIVTRPGCLQDRHLADDLKRHVAERKPSCMHLHGGVYFVDALPKNSLGKDKSASLQQLLGTLLRMDYVDEHASGNLVY